MMTQLPEDVLRTATALADARRRAVGLDAFPGGIPKTPEEAYRIQSAAVEAWGETVSGWKVGRLAGEWEQRFGVGRFIGPIFSDGVVFHEGTGTACFPAIAGGSAALEAELVVRIGEDVAPRTSTWSVEDARTLVTAFHIGIEVAGSPVPGIDELGPLASTAAFGNNLALIVGPAIDGWDAMQVGDIACRVTIDGRVAGTGTAGGLPGGPFAAIAFALNAAAERGVALASGCWISTGAITGVHAVRIGQSASADFYGLGRIDCDVVKAQPS